MPWRQYTIRTGVGVGLRQAEQLLQTRGLVALHGDTVDNGDWGQRQAERQELTQGPLVPRDIAQLVPHIMIGKKLFHSPAGRSTLVRVENDRVLLFVHTYSLPDPLLR